MRHSLVIDRIDSRQRLPKQGDVISTPRCVYRVLGLEQVSSSVWHDRWRLSVDRLGPPPVQPHWIDGDEHHGCHQFTTEQYRPGETPAHLARGHGLPDTPALATDVEQLALVDAPGVPTPIDEQPDRTDIRYLPLSGTLAAAPTGKQAIADIRARILHPTDPKDAA